MDQEAITLAWQDSHRRAELHRAEELVGETTWGILYERRNTRQTQALLLNAANLFTLSQTQKCHLL